MLIGFLPPLACVGIPFLLSSLLIHYWAIPAEAYACLITLVGAFFLMCLEHPKNRERMKNGYYARMFFHLFIFLVLFVLIAGCLSFPLVEDLLIKHTAMPAEQTMYFSNLFIHRNVDLKSALGYFWFDFKDNQIELQRTGLIYQYAFSFIAYTLYAFHIFSKLSNYAFLSNIITMRIKRENDDLPVELLNERGDRIGKNEIREGARYIEEFERYRRKINENVGGIGREEAIEELYRIAKNASNSIFLGPITNKLEDGDFISMELRGNTGKIPFELCAAYHQKMKKVILGRNKADSKNKRFTHISALLGRSTSRFPIIRIKQPVKIVLVEDVNAVKNDHFYREIDELRRLLFPYEKRGYFEVNVLRGGNVSYDNLKKALSECHIAHFATHVEGDARNQYITTTDQHFAFVAGDIIEDFDSVPDMIFMNGCYGGEPNGFADTFIKKGTKIVVGSYYAITSSMAANCALWFYQHLFFDGLPAGESLLDTREDTEAFYSDEYGERIYAHILYILHGNPATRILLAGRFLKVRSMV